jgi:integrase
MTVTALPVFYNEKTGRKIEAFNLFIRGKKSGKSIYYCQLRDRNGNKLSVHFSTGTNNRKEAENYVVKNYDRIISEYTASIKNRDGRGVKILHASLLEYFADGSKWLELDKARNIERRDNSNGYYRSIIERYLIPYLNENDIYAYEDLTAKRVYDLQNYFINEKVSNKTINMMFYCIELLYDNLVRSGLTESNPCAGLKKLKKHKSAEKGIFSKEKVRGLFKEVWEEETEYAVNLLSLFTGMRNSEVRLLKVENIICVEGIRFIDVINSREDGSGTKTENGKRRIPLHSFVYEKLMDYIRKNDRKDYIFLQNNGKAYINNRISIMADVAGEKLGYTKEKMMEENISFHSWRHLYNTILYESGEISGDWIEYFMGHSQRGIKGIYTHLGTPEKELCGKVFSILEKELF